MTESEIPIQPLKGKERNAFIYDLYLEEHSTRYIAELPEVQLSHVQVSRIIKDIEERAEGELAQLAKGELLKDLKKLKRLERLAWECLRNTIGTKERTKKHTKVDAGDPRWVKEVRECIAERHRLLGTYRKPPEDLAEEQVEAVRFEQAVYIPGIGFLEPEIIKQLITQSGAPDLWHAMAALAQHQQPHQYHEADADDSP